MANLSSLVVCLLWHVFFHRDSVCIGDSIKIKRDGCNRECIFEDYCVEITDPKPTKECICPNHCDSEIGSDCTSHAQCRHRSHLGACTEFGCACTYDGKLFENRPSDDHETSPDQTSKNFYLQNATLMMYDMSFITQCNMAHLEVEMFVMTQKNNAREADDVVLEEGEWINLVCRANIPKHACNIKVTRADDKPISISRYFNVFEPASYPIESPDFKKNIIGACYMVFMFQLTMEHATIYKCSVDTIPLYDGAREFSKSVTYSVNEHVITHINISIPITNLAWSSFESQDLAISNKLKSCLVVYFTYSTRMTDSDDMRINVTVFHNSTLVFEQLNFMDMSLEVCGLSEGKRYRLVARNDKGIDITKVFLTGEYLVPRNINRTVTVKMIEQHCQVSWRTEPEQLVFGAYYSLVLTGYPRNNQGQHPQSDPLMDQPRPDPSVNENVCNNLSHITKATSTCQFLPLRPNYKYEPDMVEFDRRVIPAVSFKFITNGSCIVPYGRPSVLPVPIVSRISASSDYDLISEVTNGAPFLNDSVALYIDPINQLNGPVVCAYILVTPLGPAVNADLIPRVVSYTTILNNIALLNSGMQTKGRQPLAYVARTFRPTNHPQLLHIGTNETDLSNADSCGDDWPHWDVHGEEIVDWSLRIDLAYRFYVVVRVADDTEATSVLTMNPIAKFGSVPFAFDDRYITTPAESTTTVSTTVTKWIGENGDGTALTPITTVESTPPPSSGSSNNKLLIPIIIVVVGCFVASILLILFFLRRSKSEHRSLSWCRSYEPSTSGTDHELNPLLQQNTDWGPIPVNTLVTVYRERHKDQDFLFASEFESLPNFRNSTARTTVASDLPANATKNRYNDIKAYDQSRVLLNSIPGVAYSDYINANYVSGYYRNRKRFIAAQGPKEETVGDFWRMVWEQKSQIIVMLTKLQERYKFQCYKYWPDVPDGPTIYDRMQVNPLKSQSYPEYTVRKFEIRKLSEQAVEAAINNHEPSGGSTNNGPEVSREVIQYHFTGWLDREAPGSTISFMRFLQCVRNEDSFSNTDVVVHCSAGVGRTGTFIAVDALLDQMQAENKADIFSFVSTMRNARNYMVQTLEQYVFMYKAVTEWELFGSTDVVLDRFHVHCQSRWDNNPKTGESLIKEEFAKLALSIEDVRPSETAQKEANWSKNRFSEPLCFDRNRVFLSPQPGVPDATYINASSIQGYTRPFIVAQDPLPNTVTDFWRMIWEMKVVTILMLTSDDQLGPGEIYWPQKVGHCVKFGDREEFAIFLQDVEDQQFVTIRKFTVQSSKDHESRPIVQYSFNDWNNSVRTGRSSRCSLQSNVQSDGGSNRSHAFPNGFGSMGGHGSPNGHQHHPRHSAITTSGHNSPLLVHLHESNSLLSLIGKIQSRMSSRNASQWGPLLVHCRNGSSRCGLYVCISMLLERLKAEYRIDVFQTVKIVQTQRAGVISSLSEYEFCYQTVVDYLEPYR